MHSKINTFLLVDFSPGTTLKIIKEIRAMCLNKHFVELRRNLKLINQNATIILHLTYLNLVYVEPQVKSCRSKH